MNWRTVILALVGLHLGCGGGSDGGTPAQPLDCAWLASENNCYRTTLAAAESCASQSDGYMGTFSQGRASCSYMSGYTVTFDSPIVFPFESSTRLNFGVEAGGSECLRFQQPAGEFMRITTSAGTFIERSSAETGISITCPDGTVFAAPDPKALMNQCDAGVGGGLPGRSALFDGATLSFTFLNGPGGQPMKVFSCGD